jgi:ATP-dependent protease ClpP protease subunit
LSEQTVSRLKTIAGVGAVLLFWWTFQWPSGSGDVASRQTLSITEQPDRIVLGWSGPVQEPMRERLAAAFDRYRDDRRRLVLLLNSPGGSIQHGREVVAAIRARDRAIDTLVQKAGVCASMCVPIFLAGTDRIADPEAYFMFHEASMSNSARENMKRQQFGAEAAQTVKAIEAHVTDHFFRNDIGIRGVNSVWLARMREKIQGRDIWMSGQQLVDERSGIIDHLSRTPVL